ncbi:Ger(x)C family spore germination protein [Halalkalibacter urbisdiaboli]|uniref:Ger(x)C family spore germination protein n=1 Tax=Halalkalibacter urbisdiaboli TaxID=1960589 RepID=UPI000B4305AB|nr:Ger(x)C family spore germination protein [Halalkalibacter urbisdiaboli]
MRKLVLICICLSMITGCWDRTEVNDIAIIVGSSFDKTEDNKYKVTSQMPLPGGMGGVGSSGGGGGTSGDQMFYLDGDSGRNIREANLNMQNRLARRSIFGHRRVVILGEKLAREGIVKTLDVLTRSRDSRLTVQLFVAEGKGEEVLAATPHLENLTAEGIRELGKMKYDINIRDFLLDYQQRGNDPILPVLAIQKNDSPNSDQVQTQVESSKIAIFKKDKLHFFTNEQQTKGVTWMLQKMKGQQMTVPTEDEKSVFSVAITDQGTTVRHEVKGDKPVFTIHLDIVGTIIENQTGFNFEEPTGFDRIEQIFNKEVESHIRSIFDATLSEGIDSFGLGFHLRRRENERWEKWKERWPDMVRNLEVNIEIDSTLDLPGLTTKGIGVGG